MSSQDFGRKDFGYHDATDEIVQTRKRNPLVLVGECAAAVRMV